MLGKINVAYFWQTEGGEGFLFNKNNPLTGQCTAPNP